MGAGGKTLRGAGTWLMQAGGERGENDGSTGRIGKSLVEGCSLPRKGGQQKSPRDFTQGTEAVRSAFRESCFTYCAESGPTGGGDALRGKKEQRGGRHDKPVAGTSWRRGAGGQGGAACSIQQVRSWGLGARPHDRRERERASKADLETPARSAGWLTVARPVPRPERDGGRG